MIDTMSKNTSEKGKIETSDAYDLNPKSIWAMQRKKLGDRRTSSGGSNAV